MKYVYIAGPYSGKHHDYRSYFEIDAHIRQAQQAAAELARAGVGFFCPHGHSAHFEVITPEVLPSYWYELDEYFLSACDAILMLPGWERSQGSRGERDLSKVVGRPIFYEIDDAIEWATE